MFTSGVFQTRVVFGIFYLISVVVAFNFRCPSGWTYFQHHCYRPGRTALSFFQGQTRCENAGANLASITNAEENTFVTDLGRRYGIQMFYIGLNEVAREGTYHWTDGLPFRYNESSMSEECRTVGYCNDREMDYSNWMPDQPNNRWRLDDCVVIFSGSRHRGLWAGRTCHGQKYFMCKKDANETTIECPRSFETFIELGTPVKSVSWSETAYIADSLASHVERSHSPGDELPKGVTLVKYAFRDAYNLTASCNFSITLIEVDTTPPSIHGCPPDAMIVKQADVPMTVNWILPTASDLSGNVTLLSESHAPGTIFDIGVHPVHYKFADNTGNEAECFFKISVFGATNHKDEEISTIRPSDVIPSSDVIHPDLANKQATNSYDGLYNLISWLYVLVIVYGLSIVVAMLLLNRNRNKTPPFADSRSYSKMDEENLTN